MKNLMLYYSATGNTEKMIGILRGELEGAGQEVLVRTIPTAISPEDMRGVDRLIVAFPVLAMMPPVFVRRFLGRLPRGDAGGRKVEAAVLAASGGGGYSAVPSAVAILARRGYDVAFGAEAAYAENWVEMGGVPADDRDAAAKTEKGDERAREIAAAILRGDRAIYRPSAAGNFFGSLLGFLFGVFGRRFLGKLYIADERCSSCGLCARTCPVGAIRMRKGRRARPFWKMSCENCNRCMNICPEAAINVSILNIVLQFASIAFIFLLGLRALDAWLWPLVESGLGAGAAPWIRAALIVVLLLAAHIISIGPADYFLYRWLRRLPGLRAAFSWSFSRGFRRYLAPGFKPRSRAE